MSSKLYELKVFKGTRPVQTPNRLTEVLDFAHPEPEVVKDLLRRHLIAVALRDGGRRQDAHLYHLDIHEVRNERPERDVLHTFALPVEV